jgi:hypothetical protein
MFFSGGALILLAMSFSLTDAEPAPSHGSAGSQQPKEEGLRVERASPVQIRRNQRLIRSFV